MGLTTIPTPSSQPYTVTSTAIFQDTPLTITNVTATGALFEYTTSTAHGYIVGDVVSIGGVVTSANTGGSPNRSASTITSVPTTTTFRISLGGTPTVTYTSGGSVSRVIYYPRYLERVNNKWFLGDNYSKIMYSDDFATWTYAPMPVNSAGEVQPVRGVAFNGTNYVVATERYAVYYSSNLTTWTRVATPFSGTPYHYGIKWVGGSINLFVLFGMEAGATNGQIATSPDGVTWTLRSSTLGSGSGAIFDLAVNNTNDGLVGVINSSASLGGIVRSSNGTSWTYVDWAGTYGAPQNVDWDSNNNYFIFQYASDLSRSVTLTYAQTANKPVITNVNPSNATGKFNVTPAASIYDSYFAGQVYGPGYKPRTLDSATNTFYLIRLASGALEVSKLIKTPITVNGSWEYSNIESVKTYDTTNSTQTLGGTVSNNTASLVAAYNGSFYMWNPDVSGNYNYGRVTKIVPSS